MLIGNSSLIYYLKADTMSLTLKALVFAVVAAAAAPVLAGPIQLITNGSFETGTLTGWTMNGTGYADNKFYAAKNGANAPVSAYATQTNANGGTWYALSDQTGAGGETLSQSFTKTGNMSSLILSFDWFNTVHTSYSGTTIDGSGEAGRIDIMSAVAATYDVGSGVVKNLELNAGSTTTTMAWQHVSFDLSSLAAGTYSLRFATGQCCSYQEMGVDNVSLVANVPEPASLMLGLAGFAALAWQRRRNGKNQKV